MRAHPSAPGRTAATAHAGGLAICLVLAGAGPAALAPATAAADDEASERAKRFDQMARTAYGKKDWDEAIAAFEAAYQADPMPKFLYNIARAYDKKEDHRHAIEYLERYLAKVADPKERAEAKDRLAILQIKLKKSRSPVRIKAPDGAVITVKGEAESAEGNGNVSAWLPFGVYEVLVTQEGFADDRRTVVVKADDTLKLTVQLEKAAPKAAKQQDASEAAAQPAAVEKAPVDDAKADARPAKKRDRKVAAGSSPSPAPSPKSPGGPPAWLAYTTLGAGALALVGGGVAGYNASRAQGNIDELSKRSQEGRPVKFSDLKAQEDFLDRNAVAANVLYIVGVVATATGVVLWLMVPDEAAAAAVGVVAPAVWPGGGGLTLGASF